MMFLARNLAQMNMRKEISYTPVITGQRNNLRDFIFKHII